MYHSVYLRKARELCTQYEIHLIDDEIAVGFGRTGKMFAFEHANIKPDFICLSKGLTGGYLPLSAVLTTDEIYMAFYENKIEKGFLHSHSYTGNPLACSAALGTLSYFEGHDVINQNNKTSAYISERMKILATLPISNARNSLQTIMKQQQKTQNMTRIKPATKPSAHATPGQKELLNSIKENQITICSGRAGSGKTYISAAQSIKFLKANEFRKIILIKGYEQRFGKCSIVLKAISGILNQLSDYSVIVFGADSDNVIETNQLGFNVMSIEESVEKLSNVTVNGAHPILSSTVNSAFGISSKSNLNKMLLQFNTRCRNLAKSRDNEEINFNLEERLIKNHHQER